MKKIFVLAITALFLLSGCTSQIHEVANDERTTHAICNSPGEVLESFGTKTISLFGFVVWRTNYFTCKPKLVHSPVIDSLNKPSLTTAALNDIPPIALTTPCAEKGLDRLEVVDGALNKQFTYHCSDGSTVVHGIPYRSRQPKQTVKGSS
jgi:hypothetical protein